MFIDAIENVAGFTRPVHTISRIYGAKHIVPGSSTLFFVNEDGYAITCKHVVEMLAASDPINNHYLKFKEDRAKIAADGKQKSHLKGLELKYNYQNDSTIQMKNSFVDCVDEMSGFSWNNHPTLDLAILKFNGFNKLHYTGYARFIKNTADIKQGKFLCRLGFPFPEFTNFRYDAETDDMEWTATGIMHSPRFPIEGMVTRFLVNDQGLYGIEMSTPGLRGQSGGPLFDEKGRVYGMQSSTKHLHLGFDMIDKEIMLNTGIKKVTDYSFLHLGQCMHADAIKDFLRAHNVKFYEE